MNDRTWRDHPLVQLCLLRFREFAREPEAVFWALAFPILLAAGLGVAFRGQPAEPVRVAVLSPELAAVLQGREGLRVEVLDADAAGEALRLGHVTLVVSPGPDGGMVYRYDDTNPEARTARLVVDHAVQAAGGRTDPVRITDDLRRDAGSRYIDFLVPGLVGMGIMGNTIWGLGFSIVDSRRRKLMKRIVATPMPRHYYLLSFLIWRMLFLIFEVGIPVGFGVLAFGVPTRGSIADLIGIAVTGSLAFSAIALLIASRARTIEGVSGIMNLVMLPMWILSGVFFSAARFPDAVQPFIQALPLSALVDALRANMLQGASLIDVGRPLATLGGWLAVCFLLALRLFRWR